MTYGGGCGSFNLGLDIGNGIFALELGTVDITLHGKCGVCAIYQGDFGTFQCQELNTDINQTTNKGSNDCYINVNHYLTITIGSIGNIYYTGNPDSIRTKINGPGQLIHL